jgi:flagellar basal-body rod modification protein FlgD
VSTTAVGQSGAASGTTSQATATAKPRESALGQDAFMQLLITQLTHQDPTRPKEDTEFIAQLATFSQLEKLTEIAASIKNLEQKFEDLAAAGQAGASSSSTPGTKA